MYELLLDPDAFMRRRAEASSLPGPTLVVLLAGVASVLSGLLMTQQVANSFEGNAGAAVAVGGATTVVGGLVVVSVLWVLYAGVFHIVSLAFDGEGEFRTTFSLVGWGFLPSVFGGLVTAVAMYLILQDAPIPSDPAAMAGYQQGLRNRPTYVAASVVGVALTAWQGFIWTFAVKHARRLDLRGAALTVAGPVALSILWTVYNLL